MIIKTKILPIYEPLAENKQGDILDVVIAQERRTEQ